MLAFVPQPENYVCEHNIQIIIILINNYPLSVIVSFHPFFIFCPTTLMFLNFEPKEALIIPLYAIWLVPNISQI